MKIDILCKYVVLFAVTGYIGMYIYWTLKKGQAPNMPDWIVVLFTMTWQYFFRKSPKQKEASDVKRN